MRFAPDKLDEIRARLPVSQVVGKRVRLKKVGREWVGICCFHHDTKPSLTVNDTKDLFHCFPCGATGDQFGFVMKSEGLSFPDAVMRLAAAAGVALPVPNPETVKREARKLDLIELVDEAGKFFRDQLRASPEARAYLASRKVTPDMIARFGIGYAPSDRSALKSHLSKVGAEQADMAEAGLIIAGDDIPVSYDRFRDRIIFPIRDAKGRSVGFGGRALSKDVTAKYLNSPEGPLFDKGHILYNADLAREPAWQEAPLLAVEGYMDTVASCSAGFAATVASMGTAITEAQLRGLWRMSDSPIMCLDGDSAGQKAVRRAISVALPMLIPGRSLRFAMMPAGQDPDDLIRNRGSDAFAAVVGAPLTLDEALWRAETAARNLDSPDGRAGLSAALNEAVKVIPDHAVRSAYADEFKDRLKSLTIRPKAVRSNSTSNHSATPSAFRLSAAPTRSGMTLRDAMLVSAMMAAPAAAVQAMEHLATAKVSPEAAGAVRRILDALADMPDADTEALVLAMNAAGVGGTVDAAREICHRAGLFLIDTDGETAKAVLMH